MTMKEFFRTHVTRRLIFFVIVFGVAVVLLVTDYEDSTTRRPFMGLLYKTPPAANLNKPEQLKISSEDSTLVPLPSLPSNGEIDAVLNPNGRKIKSSLTNETLKDKEEIRENIVVAEHFHKVTIVKPQEKEKRLDKEISLAVMQSKENYTIPGTDTEPDETIENEVKVSAGDVKKGYLVYSEACQIPDIDPYHPTVLKLIATTPPLDCSKDYPELTYARGNVLKINASLVEYWKTKNNATSIAENEVLCCYNEVLRAKDGQSDNSIGYSKNCTPVKDGDEIGVEFILVRCLLKGHGIIYKNYHSFVTDKPVTEERCQNFESSRNDTASRDKYNVLIIGADAMSRMNMHRQLKKTFKYLTESMGGIEMKGFNKVGDNTFPNLIPLLMGVHEDELPEVCRNSSDPMDNCRIIWDEFAEIGYRTFYAEDTPHISTFNYIKPGFLTQPTDYYYRTMIHPYEDDLGRNKKLNCHLCVGSMAEAQAVLDYGTRFVSNFGQRKYFAMSWINSMSHDFLNSASSGDHFFANFFQSLDEKSHLNRTFIILMGDHGLRWGAIRETHIGRMEERLPMLIIVPPKDFAFKYPELHKNLLTNANRLVTPFDLYATLQNVLRFEGVATEVTPDSVPGDDPQLQKIRDDLSKRSLSLFAPIPTNRSCEDASIAEAWCACHQSEPVNKTDEEVVHVAEYMTEKLNALLKDHPECSELKMNKVLKASLRTPKNKLNAERRPKSNIFDYTVEIETLPGKAKFEGTIRYVPFKHEHNLLGDVSRLNVYGNQSSCVQDAVLRKYCYCLTSGS